MLFLSDSRTNKMSFQYSFRNAENETVLGRVNAIADGAMCLKTNKAKDSNKYGIWSLQRTALCFEVCSCCLYLI